MAALVTDETENLFPDPPAERDGDAGDEPGLEIDERQLREMRSIFGTSLPQYIEPLEQMCGQIIAGGSDPEIVDAFSAAVGSLREAAEKMGFADIVAKLAGLEAAIMGVVLRTGREVAREQREEVLGLLDDLKQLADDLGGSREAVRGRPLIERLAGLPGAARIVAALARAGVVLDEQVLAGKPDEIAAVSGLAPEIVAEVIGWLNRPGQQSSSEAQFSSTAQSATKSAFRPTTAPAGEADENRKLMQEIADLEAAIERLGARSEEVQRDIARRRERLDALRREQALAEQDVRTCRQGERELESWLACATDLRAQLVSQRNLYEAALRDARKDLEHRRNELRALEVTVREEEEEIAASRQALQELETIMQRIRNRVGRSL